MLRALILGLGLCSLAACSNSWDPVDHDGDGFSALGGDCWDAITGPEGTDLSGADIHPEAVETFYDAIDQDCAKDDDFDADGDGYVPDEYVGTKTQGVPGSGELPGGDCWDDPEAALAAFEVVGSDLTDKNGGMLDWAQPTAAETFPGADDTWYDGVDQDCAGDDDFDQDADGYRTEAYPDQDGEYGDDCVDGNDLDDENFAGDAPIDVNPAATEVWYDGTDQNCDDNDCDQDFDTFDGGDGVYCYPEECDDTNDQIYPDDSIPEIWYNGIDENCDSNDGDQDGDGYWVDDYEDRVFASGSGEDPLAIPDGWDGDCWDVPQSVGGIPTGYGSINHFSQPDAVDVSPDATEVYYDGVDQDCGGDNDFDSDGDGYATDDYPNREGDFGGDCDDDALNVFPGQFETWYDGTDDNCDGNDGDVDGDGYWSADYEDLVTGSGGTPLAIPSDCGDSATLDCSGDCDDGDADVHPNRLEDCGTAYDDDCDGDTNYDAEDQPGEAGDAIGCTDYFEDGDRDNYGDASGTSICYCDATGYYDTTDNTDCDDGDADTYPGAIEYCDGHDDDCDGEEDEDASADVLTWYEDADGDGFGNAAVDDIDCYQPTGYVADDTDCDDGRALTNPDAVEYCNDHDDDCDGDIDEDESDDVLTWYRDADGDDYGDPSVSDIDCYEPTGYVADNTDCDDTDSGDYPGATEIVANDDDEDCDGYDDCYLDDDNDGFGTIAGTVITSADADCGDSGESYTADDCDDGDDDTWPGADEYCDGHDDDCDGEVDEDASVDVSTWYRDADEDDYGDPTVTDIDCYVPDGYVADNTDCDDADMGDYPGATEIVANDDDEDCDGGDTCYLDADLDSYGTDAGTTVRSSDFDCSDSGESYTMDDCDDAVSSTYPGADEVIADGVDQDCANGDTCYEDNDGDSYGTSSTQVSVDLDCSDTGESYVNTDCDDTEDTTYPGATEVVNDGVDNDCSSGDLCYLDADYDDYGTSSTVVSADLDCSDTGESIYDTDCDDTDAATYPGADEVVADGVDQDCANGDTCYEDNDGDGYGTSSTVVSTDLDCSDSGESTVNTDCDDAENTTFPGATEVVNDGVDNDCASGDLCYLDLDYDGYGTSSTVVSADLDCSDTGESIYDTDCDDSVATTYPGASEAVDDGVDNDCDGLEACYSDGDGDGYGTSTVIDSSDLDCSDSGESGLDTDCDDAVASTNPGATDVVNDGVDNDCSAGDSCYQDSDGDGYGTSTVIDSTDLDCADSGESTLSTDCDDTVATTFPTAAEQVNDGVDNDCDGFEACYVDADGDSYGADDSSTVDSSDLDCTDSGEADDATDCDDAVSSTYPGADEVIADGVDQDCANGDTCYEDNDHDGFGSGETQVSVDLDCADTGESAVDTDCDDADAAQYPGADEYCNDEDDDCDGITDEDEALDVFTWWVDYDGDGYGDSGTTDTDCEQPSGYVATGGDEDCDDTVASTNPGADEYCDGHDDDCDGTVDEDDAVDASTWYADSDGDSYGDSDTTDTACSAPTDYVADATDCDDTDAAINTAATEVCDDVDNDCDGDIDDADADVDTSTGSTWWADDDGDSYGDSSSTTDACDQPSGYVASGGDADCDDNDDAQYPGAAEYCNDEDDDCDGSTDESAIDANTWYADGDLDGYGDPTSSVDGCDQPSGYLADSSDCLDSNDEVYPGALEYCDDGLVNDCNETDGGDAGNSCPAVGNLVINEVMVDPIVGTEMVDEWVEIYNPTGAAIDLEGMMLKDQGTDSHQILSSVVVPAGGYVVLVRDADTLDDYDYAYDGVTMANSTDEVVIATFGTDGTDGTEIDVVAYTGGWPNNDGNAMALGYQDASSNDTVGNWAAAECIYDLDNSSDPIVFDQGTPGDANDIDCPEIDQVDPSEIAVNETETVTISGGDLVYDDTGDVVVVVGEWGVDSEITPSSVSATEVDFTAPSSSSQGSEDVVIFDGKYISYLEDGINYVDVDTAYIWWPIPATHASYGRDMQDDSSGTLEAGDDTETLYGRVYQVGVADCTIEPTSITVELGFGPAGTDPRYDSGWTWSTPTFNSIASKDPECLEHHSEYSGSFSSLSAGTYSWTFRYAYDGGPWLYGELRGEYGYVTDSGYAPGEVFDLDELGSFTVN